MAHAIWHMDYGKYWKDKLMSGASAVQEGVVDPLFDRAMGTAPGIPPRPWGGPSPYQGRPPSAQFAGESGGPPAQAARPRSVADIVRNVTPASLGFPAQSTAAPSAAPPAIPGLSQREQAIAAQTRASSMANGRSTGMNLATPPADPAFTRMMRTPPNPYEPSGPLTSVPRRVQSPAASTVDGYLEKPTLPRVSYSGAGGMGPGGLPPSQKTSGAHTSPLPQEARLGYGPEKAAALSRGERGRTPVGPFKKEIAEASAVEGEAITEDDKLKRMLKMMFLSDLVKGTEAPNPDYYSAISVGPASRAFAPLPSMFRGR